MYITSRKIDEGRILRYTMDGKNEEVLVSGLSWPSGLDIDFTNQIIYWCDSQSDLIETADIDGKNRRTVWKGISTSDQFDVAAHGGFIYWTDWSQKGLFRVLPDGTGRTKLGADLFLGLNDIKFFSNANSNATTACTGHNGQCSHFCIPLPGRRRTCECPDSANGSVVLANGNNCPGGKFTSV
ncbi:hypothetical protein NP493_3g09004 [Ridgeia piscesae]|uniref:Uncharacterized protein n=1 Tax=Ridgeia piscesae TaxID=27915 RepID=A0AAD9ULM5_RIDPI|nr:hypothetical protein NP493_3g09004 [Ridgeia piscesae]